MRALTTQVCSAFIAASIGPLAFYAPKGLWIPIALFLLFKVSVLLSITVRDYKRVFSQYAVYLILPLYAILSMAWASVPQNAGATGLKILGYFIAGVLAIVIVDRLSEAEKRSVLKFAAAGLAIACLLAWVDLATGGALLKQFWQGSFNALFFSRGAAITACFFFPVTLGLYFLDGARLAIGFAAICAVTIFLLPNEAAKVALSLGLVAYVIVRWRQVLFWPVLLLPLAVGVLFPAFFANGLSNNLLCVLYNGQPSAAHRLIIYEFTSRKIFQEPMLGWGMDSSRSIPGGGGEAFIPNCRYQDRPATTQRVVGLMPLHPHNASLQVWLELGAVGVAIVVGLLLVLMKRCRLLLGRTNGLPMIAGLFTTIFLLYNIGFGLWQSWLIFALMLVGMVLRSLGTSGLGGKGTPSPDLEGNS